MVTRLVGDIRYVGIAKNWCVFIRYHRNPVEAELHEMCILLNTEKERYTIEVAVYELTILNPNSVPDSLMSIFKLNDNSVAVIPLTAA